MSAKLTLKPLIESMGAVAFYAKLVDLLNAGTIAAESISLRELAEACGVVGRMNPNPDPTAQLQESGPGVNPTLFAIVSGELVGRLIRTGFEDTNGFIGHELVTVMPTRRKGGNLGRLTALGGGELVATGANYQETSFEEKTFGKDENKFGRILSVPEELVYFDEQGEINRRAMDLGHFIRQTWDRSVVRGVIGAETSYRPDGIAATLYATDGSNQNYIGAGGVAGYNAAVPLVDHTDVDHALAYRATQVNDDRIDGQDPQPFISPAKILLTSEAKAATGRSIINATHVETTSGSEVRRVTNHLGFLKHLHSPFVDEVSALDWYLGDMPRQFIWSEIWPLQTFLQRGDSNAAFERDVALRVKVRYFGGLSAVDTRHVTQIKGS